MPALNNMDRSVSKYLTQHADVHSRVADAMDGQFEHGVMIPAFAEGAGLVEALASIPHAVGGVLVVVVVNRSADATLAQIARHEESLRAIADRWPRRTDASVSVLPSWAAVHAWPNGRLVVLDVRVSRRRGVGLARKIGCDVLLRLWANGTLRQPWLHMSDADSRWPADFFGRSDFATPTDLAPAALIRTYVHEAAVQEHAEACLRYEARLRHHVLGLQWAGSPYAYEAIGSTISCNALAYAQVRGVPSRPAAEDFYLLNKLAKLGEIRTVRGAPMRVSGRVSDRVPFGTGAALTTAVASEQMPRCYEPRLFVLLRMTLQALAQALDNNTDLATGLAAVVDRSEAARAAGDTSTPLKGRNPRLWEMPPLPTDLLAIWYAGVVERGLAEVVEEVQASRLPLPRRRRRLADQVDAFATLKLMHAWRSRGLPDVSVEDAVARSPFCVAAGIVIPQGASVGEMAALLPDLAALELVFEFEA